ADDQVFEPRLERAFELAIDRAEDVERDREPLEPQEEGHQVVRRDEEAHACPGRGEQRVELRDVLAHSPPEGDADAEQAGAADDHRRQRAEAVAAHGVGDDALPLRRVDVDQDRVHERAGEARRCRERSNVAPDATGKQYGGHQCDAGGAEQEQLRREGEPVDVRRLDHFAASNCVLTSLDPWSFVNERCVIAAGQTDSASGHAPSGPPALSRAGRGPRAWGEPAGPGDWCSTAEISRSMYIAASTIATAPTTA